MADEICHMTGLSGPRPFSSLVARGALARVALVSPVGDVGPRLGGDRPTEGGEGGEGGGASGHHRGPRPRGARRRPARVAGGEGSTRRGGAGGRLARRAALAWFPLAHGRLQLRLDLADDGRLVTWRGGGCGQGFAAV